MGAVSARETIVDVEEVLNWDRESVKEWMEQNGLGKYKNAFFKRRVDGKQLLDLNEDKLKELGVNNKDDIQKILNMTQELAVLLSNQNLTEIEMKRIDLCIAKIENLRGLGNLSEEKKRERAKKLVVKSQLLESYLNKEFVATRKVIADLIEDMSITRDRATSSVTGLTSTASESTHMTLNDNLEAELKNDQRELARMRDELSVMTQYENQKKKTEEFLRVKLVIVEIDQKASQRTFRKVLSPIMDAFDISPQFGLFHSALIIGPFYLEWNNSGLVIPRRCYSGAALIAADVAKEFKGMQVSEALDKMADVICNWNANIEYNQKTRNCQTFVDELCAALGIELNFTGALADYLEHARRNGVCDLKFPVSDRIREKLGISDKYKTFANHQELDAFVSLIREKDALYFDEAKDDWVLLKSFDRAFWLRHFKTPTNADWRPEDINENNFFTSCPFGHPYCTQSMIGSN